MTPTHAVLSVPDISCSHCKMAIEDTVGALDGVEQVAVDIAEKSVTVDFNEAGVTLETIEAAVREEGYEVAAHTVSGG